MVFPSIEKSLFVIFGIEEGCKILNLISFFLYLDIKNDTFLFRMQ